MKLHAFALSLTLGLCWALTIFISTLLAVKTGYLEDPLFLVTKIYPGYDLSYQGAFVGMVWAFADAFIGTYICVSVYNFFVKKLKK
ncbi:hypothetical protein KKC94_00760 [Patescibacteria group bacterium]|nr:hypothetical protein [Patescibacteria group bacterium]